MSIFARWKKSSERDITPLTAPVEAEKRELQAELAQAVITFERRNHSAKRIADLALQSMREGQSR